MAEKETSDLHADQSRWIESMKRLCPVEDRIALAKALLPDGYNVVRFTRSVRPDFSVDPEHV